NEGHLAHPNGLRQLAGFRLEERGGEPLSNAQACLEKPHSANALVYAPCRVSNHYTIGRSLADNAFRGQALRPPLARSCRKLSAVLPALAALRYFPLKRDSSCASPLLPPCGSSRPKPQQRNIEENHPCFESQMH